MKDLAQMSKREVAWWIAEQITQMVVSVGCFYGVRAVFDKINPPTKKAD
jgi:hypothetical protein